MLSLISVYFLVPYAHAITGTISYCYINRDHRAVLCEVNMWGQSAFPSPSAHIKFLVTVLVHQSWC